MEVFLLKPNSWMTPKGLGLFYIVLPLLHGAVSLLFQCCPVSRSELGVGIAKCQSETEASLFDSVK